ncbi:class I SAM-dependent methyltransferase [Oceanispirochaeta crateris]|uniref:Class I SAM-dependent methyltransferase n=1 Tax=Oceanispirochaeta crateris TaxID=2518645 RepID=A0A5C1QQ17_9SPIO|nr:class I SAM-dependent methyltransferase [Oceanispirochaeta crateris]QEN08704.1 class I SAM-dependent methyltransferase [Oceanispirochaeta crateris]
MDFFQDRKNVDEYIGMIGDDDGRELVELLRTELPDGASVLELGMGPGRDLNLLKNTFKACGSDSSTVFLDLYREKHPESDLLKLDVRTLETDRTFDALYSNKVLHHLKKDELIQSVHRQTEILNSGGIICHSFWRGTTHETMEGLFFQYYLENEINDLFGTLFDILHLKVYKEFEHEDSILLLARLKS